jgi:hypothetical protein
MREAKTSDYAKILAHRIMEGKGEVSNAELRIVLAQQILLTDNLNQTLSSINDALWSEEKLLAIISGHCAKMKNCPMVNRPSRFWNGLGVFVRGILKG